MQDAPLTVDLILRRCLELGGSYEVVSATPQGVFRHTWREVGERALRLCRVLERLGVGPGGHVGTFAWNSHRHVELLLAAPSSGRVVHPVNIRLSEEHVAYTIGHAGDEVLFVDASLTPTLARLKDRLSVREVVVMEDGAEVDEAFRDRPRYEELLAAEPGGYETPELDERAAAWICYTSGTTGNPKGVVASHRAVLLHSMALLMHDSHRLSRLETVLPAVGMFHVAGWGHPYACAFAPAKLVLPGRDLTPDALTSLIEAERVTVLAGVPTIWLQLERALGDGRRDVSSLRSFLCGGSAVTRSMLARASELGIEILQGWGMTEMLPVGTSERFVPGPVEAGDDQEAAHVGIATPGIELRLVSETGDVLPWDGTTVGELEVRGLWVIRAYLDPEDDANETRFRDGWLRTGDLARIQPDGVVHVVDRAKDLIKSGGEWISSLDLERAITSHPDVAEAAVVAMPHPHWGERPVAIVVPAPGRSLSPEALLEFLRGRVAKWWLPDAVEIVDEIPKTGVGKYDKRTLRKRFAGETGGSGES